MKKKFLLIAVCMSVVTVGYVSYGHQKKQKEKMSDLALANIEALANDDEAGDSWWDRKDYECIDVTCECILYRYSSQVSQYMGAGKGTVAHMWDCTGCGGCGWTVKSN